MYEMDACGAAAPLQHKVIGPSSPSISVRRCLSQHRAFGPCPLGAAKCNKITKIRSACQAMHHDRETPTPVPWDYDYRTATAAPTCELVRHRSLREVAGEAVRRGGDGDSEVAADAAGSMSVRENASINGSMNDSVSGSMSDRVSGSMNDSVSGSASVNPLLLSGRGGLLDTLTQSLQRGEGRAVTGGEVR